MCSRDLLFEKRTSEHPWQFPQMCVCVCACACVMFEHHTRVCVCEKWCSNIHDSFHRKCYTPNIHQIEKLRLLAFSWYKIKLRFWFNLNLYREIWVSWLGGFRGCGIFSGICRIEEKTRGIVSPLSLVKQLHDPSCLLFYSFLLSLLSSSCSLVKQLHDLLLAKRGGGLGSRPKKMYGERLGDGVEYHLRRGVCFMKFLENGSRPQPPPLLVKQLHDLLLANLPPMKSLCHFGLTPSDVIPKGWQ